MITVGYLKKRLEKIDDDALVYGYEGEICGIIIVSSKKHRGKFGFKERKTIAEISAHGNDRGALEDNQKVK